MKRFYILFLTCLFFSPSLFATKDTLCLSFRLSGTAGMMMKDGKVDPWIGKRPLLGGNFAVEFQPTGRWHSLQQWNNTSIGLGFSYLNLGNKDMLGDAFALHAHLNTPFVRLPHFVFGIRPTVGIACVTKYYNNTLFDGYTLYKDAKDGKGNYVCNWSIGSVVNAYLAMDLFMDFPIKDGFEITCSYGWHHISNGGIQHPNAGYNMLNGEIGLRYTPRENPSSHHPYERPKTDVPHHLYDGVDKKWDVEIGISGGVKQNYYRDNYPQQQYFGAGVASISAHWIPLSIFKIGLGIDAFYDGYYQCVNERFKTEESRHITHFGKTYLKESNVKNCFRVGLSLQPEFIIGNLTAGIHLGMYVFDPIKNLEPYKEAEAADKKGESLHRGLIYKYDLTKASNYQDGWFYTRFLLKYRCTDHLFVQLGLKTHGARAEFIDAGLGVAF